MRRTRNEERGTSGSASRANANRPVPRSPFLVPVMIVALLILAPTVANACTVCWGSPDDPMVKSVNKGIWVLLGFIGFVQVGFAALFISFWWRARQMRRFKESLRVIEGGPTR